MERSRGFLVSSRRGLRGGLVGWVAVSILFLVLIAPKMAKSALLNEMSLEVLRSSSEGQRSLNAPGKSSLPGWANWLKDEPRLRLVQARILLSRDETERALRVLEALEGMLPDSAETLRQLLLAESYKRMGQLEKAYQAYTLIGSSDYLAQLAHHAVKDNRNYQDALRYMSWALSLQPDRPDFHAAMAQWHLDQGDPDSALDYWREAVLLAPNEAAYRIMLADTLTRLGYITEAELLLDDLVEEQASSLHGEEFFRIGIIYRNSLGMSEPGLAALEQAVDLDSANPLYRIELGRSYQYAQRYAEAGSWYESVASGPEVARFFRGLAFEQIGILAQEQDHREAAIQAYQEALTMFTACEAGLSAYCEESEERVVQRLGGLTSPLP